MIPEMKLFTLVGSDLERNLPVPARLMSETDDIMTLALDADGKAFMRVFKTGVAAVIEEPLPTPEEVLADAVDTDDVDGAAEATVELDIAA